ncbi:MAG: hypothetical protein M3478_06455 [Planctomycetota bacterium]|nr:hypothetical protein [Planctomycetota bacterium]
MTQGYVMYVRRAPFIAAILLGGSLVTLAQDPPLNRRTYPATAPATNPTSLDEPAASDEEVQVHPKWQSRKPPSQPVAEPMLQAWFNELGASDAALRERATTALLDLTRDDLAALRRVVERSRPVSPSQAGALRDVVAHVYLSAEIYDCEPRVGFLGLILPTLDSVDVPRSGDEHVAKMQEGAIVFGRTSTGVPVDYRIPGFCAYRALRDGDVVLGILHPIPRRLRDWNELTYSIKAIPAGEQLTLEVLRQGTVLNVPVTLDAKPLVANDQVWSAVVLPAREAAAEAYWVEHFASLMGEDRVSSAPNGHTQAAATHD